MIWIFYVCVVLAISLPLSFVASVWYEAHHPPALVIHDIKKLNWISPDSRDMYLDIFKTVSSAGTIAAALVSAVISTANQPTSEVRSAAKFSVSAFIISTMFSIMTIAALSRFYDRAHTRFLRSSIGQKDASTGQNTQLGQLLDNELRLVLFTAFIALSGCLVGFLYLARIVFVS